MNEFNLDIRLDELEYEPLEIELVKTDSFLTIRETLTRIGIYSKRTNILWQSCHLLQKKNRYYIVHFKELFALDGRKTDLTDCDIERRNRIGKLLEEWGMVKVVNKGQFNYMVPTSEMTIIPHRSKSQYELRTKYMMQTERNERMGK